jgi:hypothetical protein
VYTKHEDNRRKFQKVKCPYCQENSNITSLSGSIQFRTCKNNHNFVYDKELEYIRNTTHVLSTSYMLVQESEEVVKEIPRVKMTHREGDKRAVRYKNAVFD